MRAPDRTSLVALAIVLPLSLGACRDREQQANIDGVAARGEVAAACASASSSANLDADAGDPADLRSACVETRCRERCGAYAGTKTFERTCLDACAAVGACNTNADCATGLRCIAIAPVVRRCIPLR